MRRHSFLAENRIARRFVCLKGVIMKRKKKRRRHLPIIGGNDTHHIFWYRKDWSSGYAKKLREHWYSKVTIPRCTLHKQIHEGVRHIPVPSSELCKATYLQICMLEERGVIHPVDPFDRRLKLFICCLDNGDSPTADALRKQLAIVEQFYEASQ